MRQVRDYSKFKPVVNNTDEPEEPVKKDADMVETGVRQVSDLNKRRKKMLEDMDN